MTLLAGAARVAITPPLGVPTGGGGPDGYLPTTSVIDPLYVRALLLDDGDVAGPLLLLQADLLGLSATRADALAAAAGAAAGVAAARVVILCPQSHNSGTTFNRGYPDQELTEFVGPDHRAWVEGLGARFAAAATQARAARRPVVPAVVRGQCRGVCANRRARLKNGRIAMAWGDPDPATIARWGADDPELVLAGFLAPDTGALVAALWHFTGHPNSLWMLPAFSRDYPGVVEDLLTAAHPGAVALFANGFCGDVDTYPCMRVTKELYTYPFYKEPGRDLTPNLREMRRLGTRLGRRVVALAARLPRHVHPWRGLGVARERLACVPRADAPAYAEHFPPAVELVAVRIGEVGLAAAPFEPVVRLGLALKRRGAAPFTLPVGHTPSYTGYLPDAPTLAAGGFEAGTSWRGYAPGTGEAVVRTLLRLLRRLFPRPRRAAKRKG